MSRIGDFYTRNWNKTVNADITILPESRIEKDGIIYVPVLPFDEAKIRSLLEKRDYATLEAYGYTKSGAENARIRMGLYHAEHLGTRPYFTGVILPPTAKLRRYEPIQIINFVIYVVGEYLDPFRTIGDHIDATINLQLTFDKYEEMNEVFAERLEAKLVTDALSKDMDYMELFKGYPAFEWTKSKKYSAAGLQNKNYILKFLSGVIKGEKKEPELFLPFR